MIKRIIVLLILINIFLVNYSYATEEIIKSQMDVLNISSFIKEGEKYTKDAFPDINIHDLLNSTLEGKFNNNVILKNSIRLFGREIQNSILLIANVLVVVLIHSILKAFSDNLNKQGVCQITYYVEYILIVTLIMTNFSNVITLINNTISELVGFVTTLIPILLALMMASRKCCNSYIYSTNNSICNSFYS